MKPKSRIKEIEIQESGETITIRDHGRGRTIRIDPLTAIVLKECDGSNSPWEIQKKVRSKVSQEVCEDEIWAALTRLHEFGLLTSDAEEAIDYFRPLLEYGDFAALSASTN